MTLDEWGEMGESGSAPAISAAIAAGSGTKPSA